MKDVFISYTSFSIVMHMSVAIQTNSARNKLFYIYTFKIHYILAETKTKYIYIYLYIYIYMYIFIYIYNNIHMDKNMIDIQMFIRYDDKIG